MLTNLAVPFFAGGALVALRAFQTRNVQAARYGAMIGTCMLYAFAEAYVVASYVVANGQVFVPAVVAYGLGGGIGCAGAVYVSKRVFHD